MGNEAAKVIVPVALQSLPVIIKAIRGDDNSSASRTASPEDRRILEALENMQRNRDDIDRILQNQQQLTEAFMLLGQRVQEGGGNLQLQNGTCNQLTNGTSSRGRIRIEMDLPEGAEEREEALRRFWITLANQAAAFTSENGSQSTLSNGSKNGSEHGEKPAIAASAPPGGVDESSQELGKLDSFLYCEICTLRYNTTDRRPTLLSSCGHTFCKECLCKANRRNHRCPHCRQMTNENVDQHPTNFAILDFLKESEEDLKPTKKEEVKIDIDAPDLTFEEQLEIARQLSLEESRSQQNSQEQRNRQEEEDHRMALQLQEEEERVMAFRYHADKSLKARNLNDSHEFTTNHGDHSGITSSEHYPVLLEEDQVRDRDRNVSDDDDLYDDCHAVLRPNRATYGDAYRELGEVDDRKKSCDSEDDCHLESSAGNGYSDARHLLSDVDDAKNCSDSDDECLKSGKGQESNDKTLLGEEICGESSKQNSSITEADSLYQEEKDFMLQRAEDTHRQEKERRRKNKRLKEQEEIDLAMALSLSLCDTRIESASNK